MGSKPPARDWARGRCIGKGSFGAVHLAVDRSNGWIFAVKSVTLSSSAPSSVAYLEEEIRILRSLSSPYVVSYLGDDVTEERPSGASRNLHMEYVSGGTLAARLGAMDEPDVRAYTRCLARALHYLHSVAGVVHGDVKGRNVLVDPDSGVAKLADFGSANRISDKGAGLAVRGTPLWMAPEVARGGQPGPESDVWSLGCTVIEMATGKQPWDQYGGGGAQDARSVLFHVGFGNKVPEFPTHLSAAGRDFLAKCLKRDADERWSCEQLLRHPFLAEDDARAVTGPSPRSVLDWANIEFQDDGEEEVEEEEEEENYDSNDDEPVAAARQRIKQLASGAIAVSWDDEDSSWIAVREAAGKAAEESAAAVAEERVGEGEGIRWVYLDCGRAERGEEASGVELEEGMRCAAGPRWCCNYCGCSWCEVGLDCQHGTVRRLLPLIGGSWQILFNSMIVKACVFLICLVFGISDLLVCCDYALLNLLRINLQCSRLF